MVKKFFFIWVAILLAFNGTVFAEDWICIAKTAKGEYYVDRDNFKYYRDNNSTDKNTVEAGVKWVLSPDEIKRGIESAKADNNYSEKWENIRYLMMFCRYRLDERQSSFRHGILYDKNDNIVFSLDVNLEYQPIKPGSNEEWVFELITDAVKNGRVK